MRPREKGQSTIEFLLVVILVTMAIVVTGPYVLRSLNAHFKLWDDSVQDALSDRVVETPSELDPNHVPCYCTDQAQGCGVGGCPETSRLHTQTNCNHPGCGQGVKTCTPDPTCCTTPIRGECGDVDRSLTLPANKCYFGQRILRDRCGSDTATRVKSCATDVSDADGDPDCSAICLGSIPEDPSSGNPTARYCTGDDEDLNTNTAISIVSSCTDAKCEMLCNAGYEPSGLDCVPIPTCTDGIKNQDESDIDCGGDTCPACPEGPNCSEIPSRLVISSSGGDGNSDVWFDYSAGTITQMKNDPNCSSYHSQNVSLVLYFADGSHTAYASITNPNIAYDIGTCPTISAYPDVKSFGKGWDKILGVSSCTGGTITRSDVNGFDTNCTHLKTRDAGQSRGGTVTMTDIPVHFTLSAEAAESCSTPGLTNNNGTGDTTGGDDPSDNNTTVDTP